MGGTYSVVMGDRGRLVVPVELRDRLQLTSGTPVILVEGPDGVVLMTRDQARDRLANSFAGRSLVEQLMAERRAAADGEDAA